MVIPETTLFEFENWYWITIKTIENCSWDTNRKRKKIKENLRINKFLREYWDHQDEYSQ